VKDNGDGTYGVTYMIDEGFTGAMKVQVMHKGEHIKGSPFTELSKEVEGRFVRQLQAPPSVEPSCIAMHNESILVTACGEDCVKMLDRQGQLQRTMGSGERRRPIQRSIWRCRLQG
jgi:hypothetical protein